MSLAAIVSTLVWGLLATPVVQIANAAGQAPIAFYLFMHGSNSPVADSNGNEVTAVASTPFISNLPDEPEFLLNVKGTGSTERISSSVIRLSTTPHYETEL